ncbi:AAA family ATPase [Micromonospora sp. B11E3]|uniref:ATP-binding protein n=1 Tax=Micromonospora sp. B11E3 TaxID=3153562 RepID=UPI00325F3A6B
MRACDLVGRDDELRAIELATVAAREGHGQALFLTGESGIGRSRLAASAGGLASAAGLRLLRGRAGAIGPTIPLRALTEALLSLRHDPAPVDLAAVGPYRRVLARLVPDWAPAAAPDPGGPADPAGAHQSRGNHWSPGHDLLILAEGVLRLAGLAAEGRGCLLILEDLHDADAETLAVVDYLVDHLDRQAITLLGTLRAEPGPALDLARAAARRGACRLIELHRLDRDDLRRLAAARLDTHPADLPEAALDLLWAASGGNPALAGELLDGMVAGAGAGAGGRPTGGHHGTEAVLVRSLARQVGLLDPGRRELLSLAAVLGPRVPLALLRRATGRHDQELVDDLRSEPLARLIVPDGPAADSYAFPHPLLVTGVRALLSPADRSRLARRAAEAVADVHPGLPGPWCQTAAGLRLDAGDRETAGRLFAEAGRRAVVQGAAESAVALLARATDLLATGADSATRAEVLDDLIVALTEAGLPDRALDHAAAVDDLADALDRPHRVRLHTSLAWAAAAAGRPADGLAHVDVARALLPAHPAAADSAPVDVVAACLTWQAKGPEQLRAAEAMVRRAEAAARAVPLPIVACRAALLLSVLTGSRDPDEATACLDRAWTTAVRHNLPSWEILALVRRGEDDALRDGDLDRLEQAERAAAQVGAVAARQHAEAARALHAVLRADFAAAALLTERARAAASGLTLPHATRYALLLPAVLAAHQGRQRRMNDALAEFCRYGGDQRRYLPVVHGLAGVFCALLQENRSRALAESWRACRAAADEPTWDRLAGRYGVHALLRALAGDLDPAECSALAAAPAARFRWNRQFVLFTRAVLAGRAGRPADAVAAVAEALHASAPYPTARHLGLRLVSEAALTDGWGRPVEWLRTAEEYFHAADAPAVVAACRALLRRAGARPLQRRAGVEEIPPSLRSAGVTLREYEVLRLLVDRLSNREIAHRLHLSSRTVEKHVASLIAKTGQPDRIALGQLAAATAATWTTEPRPPAPPDG